MPSTNEDRNRELDIVKRATLGMMEHFDTVQVFATRHDPHGEGGTVNIQWGQGNWFARYGHIRNWVNIQEGIAAREGDVDDVRDDD
jgi:hypothetical protein